MQPRDFSSAASPLVCWSYVGAQVTSFLVQFVNIDTKKYSPVHTHFYMALYPQSSKNVVPIFSQQFF